VITTYVFHPDGRFESGGRELAERPLPDESRIWVDVEGHGEEEEQFLRAQGFHPLAVEDVLTLQHQPKLEDYHDHLFVIVRGLDFNQERLSTLKLAAFVDDRRLVTCHRAPLRSVLTVREMVEAGRQPPSMTRLFYRLCDEMMDLYFPLVEKLGQELEAIEDAIFVSPEVEQLEKIQGLRRRLTTVRRAMLPHRQVFNHLASRKSELVDEEEAVYFRDIYDNVFRLMDLIDGLRDQLASAKDTYLSAVSQKTNEVMKVLTLFSAVLLPLTFIAGLYGMNFSYIPELRNPNGYFIVLGVMVVMAVGMVVWFRRKDWL
jgi:magnesium transporter